MNLRYFTSSYVYTKKNVIFFVLFHLFTICFKLSAKNKKMQSQAKKPGSALLVPIQIHFVSVYLLAAQMIGSQYVIYIYLQKDAICPFLLLARGREQ